MNFDIPPTSGTYVLILYLRKGAQVAIGRLGTITFKQGWYAYVGSAFGPGGLAARLGRHLKKKKTQRWHIDYLRTLAEPRQIWYNIDPAHLEHHWAAHLLNSTGKPVENFGCSDCRCPSHLKGTQNLFL